MNKNSLLALLLVATAAIAQAQTSNPAAAPAAGRTTASAPRAVAPAARVSHAAAAKTVRPAAMPPLELRVPSGAAVRCACVRSSDRA